MQNEECQTRIFHKIHRIASGRIDRIIEFSLRKYRILLRENSIILSILPLAILYIL